MHKSSSVSQQVSCPSYILIANVGIGTTAPEQALDVNGYIKNEHSAFSVTGGVVAYNIGVCFDATTEIFKCAVTGIYIFSAGGTILNRTTGVILGTATVTTLCEGGDEIVIQGGADYFSGCLLYCTGFRPRTASPAGGSSA